MSRRTEMLGSTIQRELAQMILRDLQDPRLTGLPSITRVKVSPDLSIAEVGALDEHRRSILGLAMVANDHAYVEGALSKLVDFVRRVPSVDLIDYQVDFL